MGVIKAAEELSAIYGGDLERIRISALCHDIFRGRSDEELNEEVRKYNLDEKYLNNSNLSHGKLASRYLQDKLGIEDEEILNAISFHTTGRRGMSLIEKIVFLADAIEDGRDYPGVSELREISKTDLNKACLGSLTGTINHLKASGMNENEIDIDTINARDYFKELIDKGENK